MMIKVLKRKSDKSNLKFSTNLELTKVNWEKAEKIFATDTKLIKKALAEDNERKPRVGEILKLLAGGSIFALSLVFPTLPMALAPFIFDHKNYNQSLFNQTIKRLEKQKLVETIIEGDQTLVRITREGKVRALRYKLSEIQVKKPKTWDKKWRIVIFDIAEKYKRVREIFRGHLKGMGFYMLQESVWVYPYPCFDEIEFLRQIYKLEIDVTYILAQRIEKSEYLVDHFQLS